MSKMQERAPSGADVQTIERRPSRTRTVVIAAVVVVLALVGGVLIGMAVGGSDDEAAYVAGGGDLSDRQNEMIEMADDYMAAWTAGDNDAIVAMFTRRGVMMHLGEERRVDDGTMEEYLRINNASPREIVAIEPMVLDDYRVLVFNTRGGYTDANVIEFTNIGDVKIVRHTVVTPAG